MSRFPDIRGGRARATRRPVLAVGVALAALIAGCGGGGVDGDAPGEASGTSTPTVPLHPTYKQRVLALLEGSFTMDCVTGGSGNQVQRTVSIARDGIVRVSGLGNHDYSGPTAALRLLASYYQDPLINTTPPGVYLAATSDIATTAIEFSILPTNALRLMKLSAASRGATTNCLSAPAIGGVNPQNTLPWRAAAFADDVAYASRLATCTPSQGERYTVDLSIGTRVSQQLSVPLDITNPAASAEDAFGYVATHRDGSTVRIEVRGADNPTRTVQWHNVACVFP